MKTSTFIPDGGISPESIASSVQSKGVAIIHGTSIQTEVTGSQTKVEIPTTVFVEEVTLKYRINQRLVKFEGKATIGETKLDFVCEQIGAEYMITFSEITEKESLKRTLKPSEITVRTSGTVGNFGKAEVETSAARLLNFLKVANSWEPFTKEYLASHYISRGWDKNDMFFGLLGKWVDDAGEYDSGNIYITELADGFYEVTDEFIECCLKK